MEDHKINRTEAESVAEVVRRHIKPELIADVFPEVGGMGPEGSDAVPVLVLPSGLAAHSVKKYLDEYRTAPERREGTAKLVELESLIDHVNRFKDADSALFAQPSPTSPTLTAVLDYHRANVTRPAKVGEDGSVIVQHWLEGAPRFGKHRAVYSFPLSDEWTAWLAQNARSMPQAEFAAWLEDRLPDVADPESAFSAAKKLAETLGIPSFASPSKLLSLSRGLTVHVEDRTTNRLDLATGETTLLFETEHQDGMGAPLAVPRAFLIQIPIFRAGVAYQFAVRLKYRVGGGKVSWSYELHDPRRALDDAFRSACLEAEEQTELPLFYGAPES